MLSSFSSRRSGDAHPRRGMRGPSTDSLVRLRDVSVEIEHALVLHELDLDVEPGECVGLTGANGSGKSTLLDIVATLRAPRSGEGTVLGARLGTQDCDSVRPLIALVGHAPALYPQLTLEENLEFLARLLGLPAARAVRALEAVGLDGAARRRAYQCSQGMQRRADLARVVLAEPRLLLLDEVHTGLDTNSVGMVDDLVTDACRRGGAGIVVSHERERLESLTNRVVEIVDGRTVSPAGDPR